MFRNLLTVALAASLYFVAGCGDTASFLLPQDTQAQGPWLPPNPRFLDSALHEIVNRHLTTNDIPGALLMVTTPNGRWATATGLADVDNSRPISFEDRSAWRSITKSLTVTVVMQLVAEGRLELDAPVASYVDGVPNGESITLRQLAGMRSGLFDYSLDENFKQALLGDLGKFWTDQELLQIAFQHPVNFAPGAEYEYSNTNTIVLGTVAESVTGQTMKQLLQERLLGPLALNDSAFVDGVGVPKPAALGYVYDDDTDSFESLELNGTSLSSAGAMAGTIRDLSVWGHALVDGSLLPSELQRQRFLSGPTDGGPHYDSYGLGMGEIGRWWGHTGAGIGYQAAVLTEPQTGSQIVIILNATNKNQDVPADMARDIQRLLGWSR